MDWVISYNHKKTLLFHLNVLIFNILSISFSQCLLLNIGLIYRKPFLKERASDDSTHADSIINLLTELGMSKL